jgi:Cu/Ag efflux protein CusF
MSPLHLLLLNGRGVQRASRGARTSQERVRQLRLLEPVASSGACSISVPKREGQTMTMSRAAVIGIIAAALFSAGASAQESRLGTISRLDEANGTIAIVEAQSGTTGSSTAAGSQEFKAQDGLLFNAFKEGDRVSFAVKDIGGVKTITKLEKQ